MAFQTTRSTRRSSRKADIVQKHPAAIVVVCAGLIIALAVQALGEPPYGANGMADRIAREDSDLCTRFGFAPDRIKFEECMRDLADLRARHEGLVVAYSWP
jgi:hypothetical protein